LTLERTAASSAALVFATVFAVGCRDPVFACLDDEQCVDGDRSGTCQPNGHCSFDDASCPTGQRYGEHAGKGLAGTCVDDTKETAAGETTSNPTSTTHHDETTGAPVVDDTECSSAIWHRDADEDGFGDPNVVVTACEAPPGHVADGSDCDDDDPRVNPDNLGCPNPTSLVGWWRFDGGDGVFSDSSDQGNHASPVGAPTNDVMGPWREALRVDGSSQAVDVSAMVGDFVPSGAPRADGTLEAWVRSDGATEACVPDGICAEMVFHVGPSSHNNSIDGFGPPPEAHLHMIHDPDDDSWSWSLAVGTEDITCRPNSSSAGIHVTMGAWTHLAGTWSDGICRLYVNGRLVDEASLLETPSGIWEAAIIGGVIDHSRRWFHGAIDEVMIFTEARTESQIRADCGAPQCQP
jgi:hypothetical protein